jgi:polyisoprenyl-teichoic acid--peptidoglycan teichoic acid transferase
MAAPASQIPPPPLPPPLPPQHGWSLKRRFWVAAVAVVLLSGGATASLVLGEVGKVVEALGEGKAVKIASKVLAPTSRGAPETLLLVGNDQRPSPKGNLSRLVLPHSNEMLLVRIDPSKPTISMLSIPRELQVPINPPGGAPVYNRINAALTIGGIQLMTETIKRVLGVQVNHVFVVTFPKFRRAVDEMGCVYMTVDRRYYHVNEPGGEQYFEINLQPGYQKLCGKQALEFVANRHEDTSLVRDARDQRFLLQIKAQYGAKLFDKRDKFEHILGKAVETDLHGSSQVLDLLYLLAESQGKPVRQVPFHVNLLPSYDTATPRQIHESVQGFLGGTAPIPKAKLGSIVHAAAHAHHHRGGAPSLALTPTSHEELAGARAVAPYLPFALEYPRARDAGGGAAPDTLRRYDIRDQHGRLHPSYVISIDKGGLGEFYDVQGTSWTNPPLGNPSQEVHIGSRTYGLFYTGEAIRMIAWREGGALYWIENTLANGVQPREMVAMAERTRPVIGAAAGSASASATNPTDFKLPPRPVAATSLAVKLGALLGFVGLAVVAWLALRVLARGREVAALREQVARAMALEASQRPLLAAAGIAVGERALGGERAPAGKRSRGGAGAPGEPAPTGERGATIYRAPRRWRRGMLLAAGAPIVAALIAAGVYLSGRSASPRGGPVPVAVLNATGKPGAAHRIAGTLRANRIAVGQVGDVGASLGPGAYVLYPPGAQAQAHKVARLLPDLRPTVAPIQPQVQNAVGQHDEIVILLD